MLRHLLKAYGTLFGTHRARVAVGGLIAITAAVPVFEILVLRLFSDLIIDGPDRFADDVGAAIPQVALFLAAFAATRAAHHLVRLARVRVYRSGIEAPGRSSSPSQESWEWAQAFELSSVVVSLVQIAMFSGLFLVIDLQTGLVNLLLVVLVLAVVSRLYQRQLVLQVDYVTMGHKPGTAPISERVGGRVRAAELGAVVASGAMVVALVFMLIRTLRGQVSSADAIVLFLALRLLAGQLAASSSAMMRFARASARRGTR
jgi:hypothetical protein